MAKHTRSRSKRVISSSARSRSLNGRRRAHTRDDESIAAWFGELFTGNEGGRRRSTRTAASHRSASKSSKSNSRSRNRTMSRSEAGRAGGLAPHRCRGRECSSMSSAYRSNGRSRSRSR